MRSIVALALAAYPAFSLGAQRGTGAPAPDSGRARLHGTVYDSVAGAPLRGALVQLAAVDDSTGRGRYAAAADSAGRFAIPGVVPGEYAAAFFHVRLDSLGIESATQRVHVTGPSTRLDLATPSTATLVRAVCPVEAVSDSTGLLMGHVRATGTSAALASASVTAMWTSWTSLTGEAGTWQPRERRAEVGSANDGWFALCGVPADVPLLVRASHGADSSGLVRVTVPGGGLQHVAWLVGRAAKPARLRGRVRDGAGRPVTQAQVTIWGTSRQRASDDHGVFALDSLPGGTQTLEVRAIGFLPVTRVVHVSGPDPQPLTITLAERVTTLPATTVTAREGTSLRLRSFYERMSDAEKGINRGYFITSEELERRKPPVITNMFDGMPGIMVERNPFQHHGAVVRGPIRLPDGTRCRMAVFLDGIQIIGGLGPDHDPIDMMVISSDVAAVEVYPHPVSAPPRFQTLNGRCGVILVWTR
jgi:hypothetical protein